MFTTQKYPTWQRSEGARSLLCGALTSTHPVRVLVLSAPPPPPPSTSTVSIGNKSVVQVPPPLVGCMFCFIRVEWHDNLGMNIWDSV